MSKFNKNEYSITNRQNQYTKISSRFGNIPLIIVSHITAGSFNSADSWFRSSNNHGSSADFVISKEGKINQYGDIDFKRKTWTNGLTSGIKYCTSLICVKEYNKGNKNPNNFSVTIEHESIIGELTEEQIRASIWLHKYIIEAVKDEFDHEIVADRDHFIGHYEIDNKKKPFCPGKDFPFDRIIEEVKQYDSSPFSDWAQEAMEWAMNVKLTDGTNPKSFLNLERFITVLYRFYCKFIKKV